MINEKQKTKFEELARPLIAWLNENSHPHSTIIITPSSGEVLEGFCAFTTLDYIKD